MKVIHADICIMGASLGGVAAAWAATEAGCSSVLISEFPWIGGQVSYQGMSCLDEHKWIEQRIGATRRYFLFRDAIRRYYGISNPGNCWVSALGFEPFVGEKILRQLLAPFVAGGKLTILDKMRFQDVRRSREYITHVDVLSRGGETIRIEASMFLDATDLGDILAKADIPYRVGAESRYETGESDAPDEPDPSDTQSFCFPFAVEFCPGETHVITKPPLYEEFRKKGVFTLCYPYPDERRNVPFEMFARKPELQGSFWQYRRIIEGAAFSGRNDVSLINWVSNDFRWGSIIDEPIGVVAERIHQAKCLSLGFLYWLQTECPRDDGSGRGYPELKLRKDLMGTDDGLSMFPYIRESRRIIPRSGRPIVEEEILLGGNGDAETVHFDDSVGIGHYMIDIHPQKRNSYTFIKTKPFQIPLRAFIPLGCDNLLPASKNIATTHITNGAYRVHHIEWAIGEAAGMLAAFSIEHNMVPADIASKTLLEKFQHFLTLQGIPISWPELMS